MQDFFVLYDASRGYEMAIKENSSVSRRQQVHHSL